MNRLAGSGSAYLRAHADNPVDWYPWGPEAFARAHELDRPILVSIGYAACHWCHVMARESFADPAIAAVQNALVVSVKVDREERPDVDAVYMEAVQALTGAGGWPMTVFCLPDGRPFHAGTYFPPHDRDGLIGFPRLLEAVAAAYTERCGDLVSAAERLTQAVTPVPLPSPGRRGAEAGPAALAAATTRLLEQLDWARGGFGAGPKFPNAPALLFLLGRSADAEPTAARPGPPSARSPGAAVLRTLDAMAQGGIYDQVGGGFHRYTVDGSWRIPHFEKMLADQAQLASLYARAARLYGRAGDLRVVEGTVDGALADLAVEGGGFATSTDADTEGREGRFFVWTPSELASALGADEGGLAAQVFGVSPQGNFDDGTTVLHLPRSLATVAHDFGVEPAALAARVDGWRTRLRAVRARRVPPRRDPTQLTGGNALAAIALLDAASALDRPAYRARALDVLELVLERARRADHLLHAFHPGAVPLPATLADTAALGLACAAAFEATLEPAWLERVGWVAEALLPTYRDAAGPGWFDVPTGHDARLPIRPRSLEDGAAPSGTSLAVLFGLQAAALLDRPDVRSDPVAVLAGLAPTAGRLPLAFGALLQALAAACAGPVTVAVTGGDADQRAALLAVVRERYRPHVLVLATPAASATSATGGAAAAVVCHGRRCGLPQRGPAGLRLELARA